MTRTLPQVGLLVLFFLGLVWSFRNLGASLATVLTVSIVGAFVYLLIARQFIRVVDASHRATTVRRRVALLLAFLALACVNIAVWAVLAVVASGS
jgi:hypothetical protein